MLRLARATRLRAWVVVVYVLVVVVPLVSVFLWARRHGWFYTTAGRVKLWQRLPDQDAIERLRAIYGQDGSVNLALSFIEWPNRSDSQGHRQPALAQFMPQLMNIAAEKQLRDLDREWRVEIHDSLCAVVGAGRHLSPPVLAHFKAVKLARARAIVAKQPLSERETLELLRELERVLTDGPALLYEDLGEVRQECEKSRDDLIDDIDAVSGSAARLPALRRLQLLLRLARLPESESLSRRWAGAALNDYFQQCSGG
jgi:hypothetical protein